MTTLIQKLKELRIPYRENVSMKNHSTFRVGGEFSLLCMPESREDLCRLLSLVKQRGLSYTIIGNASNSLFRDGKLDGVGIITKGVREYAVSENVITVSCGTMMPTLAQIALRESLCGCEFLCGIPGTLGGALYMNAGAHGSALSEILSSATLFDATDCSQRVYRANELGLGYRHSLLMENENLICLDVTVSLKKGDPDDIARRMNEYRNARNQSQPLNFPSAGSYFKRPDEGFAGKLIEDCGLKGLCVGDAVVSEKHAGFIVNLGNASCEDILRLEEKVREEVSRKFGVTLEREVLLLPRVGKE